MRAELTDAMRQDFERMQVGAMTAIEAHVATCAEIGRAGIIDELSGLFPAGVGCGDEIVGWDAVLVDEGLYPTVSLRGFLATSRFVAGGLGRSAISRRNSKGEGEGA